MAAFVFWPACGMRRAAAHHIVVLNLQVSFMYFMNAIARGLVFVIVSSCRTAQSTRSSLTLHPYHTLCLQASEEQWPSQQLQISSLLRSQPKTCGHAIDIKKIGPPAI